MIKLLQFFSKKYEVLNNDELLQRLQDGDEKVLEWLYQKYFKMGTKFIIRNNGTMDEAKDVYQDAVIIVWQKVRSKKLVLTGGGMGKYLYGISRNLWLKELGRKSQLSKKYNLDIEEEEEVDELGQEIMREKERIIDESLDKIGERCKRLLMLYYFDGLSIGQLASEMNFATKDSAKSQKHRCKKKLTKVIEKTYNLKKFSLLNNG